MDNVWNDRTGNTAVDYPRRNEAFGDHKNLGSVDVDYVIDQMNPGDWEQVRSIIGEGIATGHTTFETEPPSWEKWDAGHLEIARLVARRGDRVLGWAALSPVSKRDAYRGVAELSISIAEESRGQGIGRALLDALIEASEKNEIWMLQAAIFPENTASVKLHLRCGFREVGRRERIGKLNGSWRDTVLFERRSQIVGIT